MVYGRCLVNVGYINKFMGSCVVGNGKFNFEEQELEGGLEDRILGSISVGRNQNFELDNMIQEVFWSKNKEVRRDKEVGVKGGV